MVTVWTHLCRVVKNLYYWLTYTITPLMGWDEAQAVEHSALKVCILLQGGSNIFSLGCFPFQPVVHNWSIRGCSVCGKMHIKDPLLPMEKSSLCDDSAFPVRKYVTVTICLMYNSQLYENQCALEASLNKTNCPITLLYMIVHWLLKLHKNDQYITSITWKLYRINSLIESYWHGACVSNCVCVLMKPALL